MCGRYTRYIGRLLNAEDTKKSNHRAKFDSLRHLDTVKNAAVSEDEAVVKPLMFNAYVS